MKLREKLEAVRLRKLGKSYSEIRKKIKVSKGTLSIWLKDVKLKPEQEKRLYITLRQKNGYRLAKQNQAKKEKITEEIISIAQKEFKIINRDSFFIAGLMLYWAEGDKSDESEAVKFSNSDPAMVIFMMKWFKLICSVPAKKFRICLHIHKLHCRKNIENYWSGLLKIPLNQFYKTQIKPTSLRHRRNKLYNGTCAVSISSKNLFRRIKGWKIGFIKKYKIKSKRIALVA